MTSHDLHPQAMLINLLLRNYLHYNLYDQVSRGCSHGGGAKVRYECPPLISILEAVHVNDISPYSWAHIYTQVTLHAHMCMQYISHH